MLWIRQQEFSKWNWVLNNSDLFCFLKNGYRPFTHGYICPVWCVLLVQLLDKQCSRDAAMERGECFSLVTHYATPSIFSRKSTTITVNSRLIRMHWFWKRYCRTQDTISSCRSHITRNHERKESPNKYNHCNRYTPQ